MSNSHRGAGFANQPKGFYSQPSAPNWVIPWFGPITKRIEFRGDELVELVKSKEFRTRLADAAHITMRTGHESGFRYSQGVVTSGRYWSPVFKGSTDEVEASLYMDWKHKVFPNEYDVADLLKLHFHPHTTGGLEVSWNDLYLIDQSSECEVKPIVAIGTVSDSGEGQLLLIQKRFTGFLKQNQSVLEELWERTTEADHLWPSKEYASALEIPSFVAADILHFSASSKSQYADIRDSQVMYKFGTIA